MLKLGIIGTGRIAEKFVSDAWQKSGFSISAIFNPHIESARRFVGKREELAGAKATDNPEEFWPLVDAVYIASPHETHYRYAKMALEAGKHVLCEKPMSFCTEEVQELFALAKSRQVILMEALKTAYCPGFIGLMEVVESGAIGEVVEVESCFSRLTPTNLREWQDVRFGGAFTEFGSYLMLPVFQFLGTGYRDLQFHSRHHVNGLDAFTKVDFDYGQSFASCKTGIGAKSEGQCILTGTKGYIVVQAPWWITTHFEVRHENPGQVETYDFPYQGSGLCYELREFAEKIDELDACMDEEDREMFYRYAFRFGEKESLAMAAVFDRFLQGENRPGEEPCYPIETLWAHRGCSGDYPENSIEAFVAAANTPGCGGIELDVQLTADGEVVVFHDENVGRVTDGNQKVCEYTLAELKQLRLAPGTEKETTIPTLAEVLEAMKTYCLEQDFRINIELKTSIIRYEGIEEKTYALVEKYGLQDKIVYSSFLADSIKRMKEIDPNAQTGMLASMLSDCIRLGQEAGADALHPSIHGLDCAIPAEFQGKPVRAWNSCEPFYYNDKRVDKNEHFERYGMFGVTEIITNAPGNY